MKAACILDYFFLDVHISFWKVASFKTRSVFHITGFFLYPLETSEDQKISNVFRRYIKTAAGWNRLKSLNGIIFTK